MDTGQTERILKYRNVLETLVAQETSRQLMNLPPKLVKYINPAQVIAYALNRLPPLYATSFEGWQRQQKRATEELGNQITTAVRQGLAAVQRDPLKHVTPLIVVEEIKPQEMQTLLKC
jgi:Late competence development protein ComFB